jgi:arylsulfatase A-like enzyme
MFLIAGAALGGSAVEPNPNVVLIAIDDLNDWIGCLGGHPQARTPNIDRLADRGVLFTNAHCQSPVCNPSRASLMSGLYPETTGVYFLNPPLERSPVARKSVVMPQRFDQEGYHVTAAGKLFHGGSENRKYHRHYAGGFGGVGPIPEDKISSFPGHRLWDWGAYPASDEKMPDHQIAGWAELELKQKRDQPLYLAVGFYRPHVPQYAPQKWLDLFPLDKVQLPAVIQGDLGDLSKYAIDLTRLKHVAPTHEWVLKHGQWKPLVQTYLACVSFVDHQVGRVLDALDASPYAGNTIVVLFTDHGFHLGEKERWAKRSIWRDGASVPLIIAGPGTVRGTLCSKPVQLLDIHPTLLDLAGLKADPIHEGHSLKPLLENPDADWPHLARSSFGPRNVAIISERHRYIHYHDGSEELYDAIADPHEWHNLVENPEKQSVLGMHRAALPRTYHPILGSKSTGHQAFMAAEAEIHLK